MKSFIINAHAGAPRRADDAHGHGLSDGERIADGQHHVAHFALAAVGKGDGRQVLGVNLDDGHVGFGVLAHDFGLEFPAVIERHFDFIGAIDDVIIGQDVAVLGHDDAGTDAVLEAGS
jgi:hypothetical protein